MQHLSLPTRSAPRWVSTAHSLVHKCRFTASPVVRGKKVTEGEWVESESGGVKSCANCRSTSKRWSGEDGFDLKIALLLVFYQDFLNDDM